MVMVEDGDRDNPFQIMFSCLRILMEIDEVAMPSIRMIKTAKAVLRAFYMARNAGNS